MKKILIVVLVLISFRHEINAQIQDSTLNKGSEFMTILAESPGNKLFLVYITEPDGRYEKINMDELKEKYRIGETIVLLNLLNKYSEKGWTLQQSNMTVNDGITYFYYLLSRKK